MKFRSRRLARTRATLGDGTTRFAPADTGAAVCADATTLDGVATVVPAGTAARRVALFFLFGVLDATR